MKTFIFLLFLASIAAQSQTKVLFTAPEVIQYGARCLDGSPSGFYITNATNAASRNKWVIWLKGGGFCVPYAPLGSGTEDCFRRATSKLGSSTKWDATEPCNPPSFASTWNIVVVPYCGEDLHSGTKNTSTDGLYYAGHLTVIAIIEKLKKYAKLNEATQLLFAGGSAGAVGVFINIDYVKSALPNTAVIAFPNAGWFINFPQWNPSADPRNRTGAGMAMYNVSNSYVNQACAAANPTNRYNCMLAEFSWPYVQTSRVPFFIGNSFFDTNQLEQRVYQFETYNYTDPALNQYVVDFGAQMRSTLQVTNISINGWFLTSAQIHMLEMTDAINGTTLDTTLLAWYTRTGISKLVDPCTTIDCVDLILPTTSGNAASTTSSATKTSQSTSQSTSELTSSTSQVSTSAPPTLTATSPPAPSGSQTIFATRNLALIVLAFSSCLY